MYTRNIMLIRSAASFCIFFELRVLKFLRLEKVGVFFQFNIRCNPEYFLSPQAKLYIHINTVYCNLYIHLRNCQKHSHGFASCKYAMYPLNLCPIEREMQFILSSYRHTELSKLIDSFAIKNVLRTTDNNEQ